MENATMNGNGSHSREPDPYIVLPASGSHKQTFLVFHGRGSKGEDFGSHLLMCKIPEFENLQTAFPDAKFIFPTASLRKAEVLRNQPVHQFFDIWSLRDPDEKDELQLEGLRENNAYIQDLLRAAVKDVGVENVVLWGLSQGCAIALISLLLWDGPPFAAAIGMCGWLPLRRRMIERIPTTTTTTTTTTTGDDEAQPGSDVTAANLRAAVTCLHELVGDPILAPDVQVAIREIPVFLGHGVLDPKVLVDLGRYAHSFLRSVGFDAEWREYEGLAHWFSGPMLHDIILFIRRRLGVVSSQP